MKNLVLQQALPRLKKFMTGMGPCGAPCEAEEETAMAGAMMCQIMMLNTVLERTGNRLVEQHGLTLPQWLALGCIGSAGDEGMPHSQIGQNLMLSKAPITGIVDRLERAGLVVRHADTKDRRVSRAVATPKGIETWWGVKGTLRNHSEGIITNTLSNEEQEQLLGLMDRLLDAFAQSDPTLTDIASKEPIAAA